MNHKIKHIGHHAIPSTPNIQSLCNQIVYSPDDVDIASYPNESNCDLCIYEYEDDEREYRLINGTSTIKDREQIKILLVSKIKNKYIGLPNISETCRAMEVDLNSLKHEVEILQNYKLPNLKVLFEFNQAIVLWKDENL